MLINVIKQLLENTGSDIVCKVPCYPRNLPWFPHHCESGYFLIFQVVMGILRFDRAELGTAECPVENMDRGSRRILINQTKESLQPPCVFFR